MPIVRSSEELDGDSVSILVDVDHPPIQAGVYGDVRGGGAERVIEGAQDVFGKGLQLARTCATQVVDNIRKVEKDARPDEFQVQLAIMLDAEVGAFLTKASAGAQLQVTMTWKRSTE